MFAQKILWISFRESMNYTSKSSVLGHKLHHYGTYEFVEMSLSLLSDPFWHTAIEGMSNTACDAGNSIAVTTN
jgi:hypothetical protein